MQSLQSYTTREAAAVLGVPYLQGLPLLKAAHVPARRCGAAYLWDADAVDGLKAALEAQRGAGGEA